MSIAVSRNAINWNIVNQNLIPGFTREGKAGAQDCRAFKASRPFEAIEAYAKGEKIPEWIKSDDHLFDDSNAKENLANAY